MERRRLLVTVPAEQGLRQATVSLIMTLAIKTKHQTCLVSSGGFRGVMSTLSTYLAEEALSLPPTERTKLVEVLVDSLNGDPIADSDLAALLHARSRALKTGEDKGLSFDAVFGEPL